VEPSEVSNTFPFVSTAWPDRVSWKSMLWMPEPLPGVVLSHVCDSPFSKLW